MPNWSKLLLIVVLPVLLMCSSAVRGGHITGGNITYECLGGEEYLVTLSIYRNCSESPLLPNQFIKFKSDCGDFFSISAPQVFTDEVSQLCPTALANSSCSGGPWPGMEIYKYQTQVTLPVCDSWEIYWELCTRSVTNNVDDTLLPCYKINALLNNVEAPCNNSPFITQESIPYVCVNQPVSFNAGVNESDGDSLRFYLVPGLNPGGGPIVYEAGFSGIAPIPGITIGNNSGQISFTPPNTGTYTVVIEVEEYNSAGVLIGTIRQDFIFVVENCPQPVPEPDPGGFSNYVGSGTVIDDNVIQVCGGDQFCAEMQFSSVNPASILTLSSQVEQILPGATFTTTGTNPAVAEICWTVPAGFSSTYQINITAQDDACPVFGVAYWGFVITPSIGVYGGPDVVICAGETVQLEATGDTDYLWQSFSGDPIEVGSNFSCIDCPNPVATPSETTVYLVTGLNNSTECIATDTVVVAYALEDLYAETSSESCFLNDAAIVVTIPYGSGNYDFLWDNGETTQNLSNIPAGDYGLEITDLDLGCTLDTILSIEFPPFPATYAGPDDVSCSPTYIMQADSTAEYGYWIVPTAADATFFPDVYTHDAEIIVVNNGTWTFVWVEDDGNQCTGIDSVDITFTTPPPLEVEDDTGICGLEYTLDANLPAIGTAFWSAAPGVTFDPDEFDPNATATVPDYGEYYISWNLDLGNECGSVDSTGIVFEEPLIADGGVQVDSVCGDTYQLQSVVDGNLSYWSAPSGQISFADTSDAASSVTAGAPGTYNILWTIQTDYCTDTDTVQITFIEPPLANAGVDSVICGLDYPLAALPSVGIGTWDAPIGSTFAPNDSLPDAVVTVPGYGLQSFFWNEDNGFICQDTDTVEVLFVELPVADAGPNDTICGLDYILQAIPTVGTGTWTTPAGITISDVNDPNATITADVQGTYVLTWTEDNEYGCVTTDDCSITFYEIPTPDAGPDDLVCGPEYTLQGGVTVGTPSWTGPVGTGFDPDSLSAATLVTTANYGLQEFILTENNNDCINTDTVAVNFVELPVAYAGPTDTICGLIYEMQAVPSLGTGSWTADAGVVIDDVNDPITSITVASQGTYWLTWTEDVGNGCTSQDSCAITFYEIPIPDAGPDDLVCGPEYELQGSVTVGTPLWTGPLGSGFNPDNTSTTTIVTIANYGLLEFILTENNNGCINTDTVSIDFVELPVAEAGPNDTICGLSYEMQAAPSIGVGSWTADPGVVIDDTNDPETNITALSPGSYWLTWTEDVGNGCTSQDSCAITFYEIPLVSAEDDASICGLEYQLDGTVSVGVPSWTGPAGSIYAPTNDVLSPEVSVDIYGLQEFVLAADNNGCVVTDTVAVEFIEVPMANAGLDTLVCGVEYGLQAVPSLGSGFWSGPAGYNFSPDENDPVATVVAEDFGPATFTWQEDNLGCISDDQVTVIFVEQPSADAGSDQAVCGLEAELESIPSVGSGSWYTNSSATIAPDPFSTVVDVTATGSGSIDFWWVENNGGGCTDSASVTVDFLEVPAADPGINAGVCGLEYELEAIPSVGTGVWTVPTGVLADDVNDPTTTITADAPGLYTMYWVETLGPCVDSAAVTIEFVLDPVADAGEDESVCGLSYDLEGSSNVSNGLWMPVAGLSFDDDTDPTTTVSADNFGTYTLTFEVYGGADCGDSDEVEITFVEGPEANAGLDDEVCGLSYDLSAVPSSGDGMWSGPVGAIFSDAEDPNSTVTVDAYGTAAFTWTETTPFCSISDEVLIDFFEIPIADAGDDDFSCGLSYELNATPSVGTGAWTSSDPGVVFVPDVNTPNAVAEAPENGSFSLTWTETNGPCSSSATIVVAFTDQPVASAGNDDNVCGLSYTLSASGSGGEWTGPPGVGFLPSANDPNATVTVPDAGSFTFTWTIDAGNDCSDSDEVTIEFFGTPQVANVTTTCIDGNINYVVSFTISGGDPGTYTVTGDGTLTANEFTSDPIQNGGTYSFELQDANGCEVVVVSGSNVCPNLTYAGTMNQVLIDACGNNEITAIHNGNNTLDGNDAFIFILQSNPSLPLGDVFAESPDPTFGFEAGMVYGQTYYICAVIGNSDGMGGVDFSDPLLSVASGTPVVFYETPTAIISGGGAACEGDTIWATVNFTGAPPFQFTYAFNGQIQAPVSVDEMTFQIPMTESGQLLPIAVENEFCTGQAGGAANAQFNPLPQAGISGYEEVCEGEDEMFTVDLEGLAPFAFVYAINNNPQPQVVTNQNSYDISASEDGLYTLISVEDQTCVGETDGEAELEVTPIPEPITGPDVNVCYDASGVTIGGDPVPGYSYQWSNSQFLSDDNAADPEVIFGDQFFVPVELTFTLTVNDNGCAASESVDVTLLPTPTIETNASVSMCEGGAAQLQVSGANNINWQPNEYITDPTAPMPFVYPPEDQVYSVSVSNSYGCSDAGEVLVVVNPMPVVDFVATVDTACVPAVVSFQNLTSDEFTGSCQWYFGNGSASNSCNESVNAYYTQHGQYDVSLTVTTDEGCAFTMTQLDLINTTGPQANFSYSPNPADISNAFVSFKNLSQNAQTYLWDFNELGSSMQPNPQLDFPDEVPGEYEVCLTAIDQDGCLDEYCTVIEVEADLLVYVPNAFSPNGDGINDLFYPVAEGVDVVEYDFKIFNRRGKLVWSSTDPDAKWNGTDQTSEYLDDNQTYVWKLRIKDRHSSLRVDRTGHVMVVR